jgi:probable rRNA maturation factor
LARELESPSVLRWASVVLDGERAGPAALSITFLSERAMRALNGRALGHDRVTDVIAFRFEHLDAIAGDIYVCPVAARRSAHEAGISPLEELLRLVVHGVLHVLGHDHPDDASRTASSMWKLQERYVQRLKDVQDR